MQNQNQENASKKKRLQMEMILKDSDYKKNIRRIAELEMQIKDLKKKKNQLEIELTQREAVLKKTQTDQIVLLNDMKKLKNTINLL